LYVETALRVDEYAYLAWTKRAVPRGGDIILAREAPVGNVGIVRPGLQPVLGQRTVLIRPRADLVDPWFLNYLLSGPRLRGWMAGVSVGATVPHLNMADIRAMELPPLPPLLIQRKIGAVLSAYDDFIENNSRRIRILEELAQRTYHEWFVEFRYPGRASLSLVDSPLGPIPKGWRTGKLSELVDVNANTIRKIDPDETIQYIDISSVTKGIVSPPRCMPLIDAPGRARRRVTDGDTLWSTVRPNLRAHALLLAPGDDCVASTGFAVLSPRHASFAFIYAMTTTDSFVEYLTSRATGATYPAVTPPIFENAPVVLPPSTVLHRYADVAEPVMRLAGQLAAMNDNLRSARDILLPVLVSGEIDLADLEIAMPEEAA